MSLSVKTVIEVLSIALRSIRWPLGACLAAYMLSAITVHLFGNVLLPKVCSLPVSSLLPFCEPAPWIVAVDAYPVEYSKLMEMQSLTFEQLLDKSAVGSELSMDIKKAEMAIKDLVILVRISDLSSRDVLADSLAAFASHAKQVARDLQRLSARVGGAVDRILAMNDYSLRTIEAASQSSPTHYDIDQVLRRTFMLSMDTISSEVYRIILEATVSMSDLDKLEEQLCTIHEIVAIEDASLCSAREELLTRLWTRLGGNRSKRRKFEDHLQLLRNVGVYRTRALAHVVAALQSLQNMSDEIEELRQTLAAPGVLEGCIPVEVYVLSIKNGMDRLRNGRTRAKQTEGVLTSRDR